VSRHCQLVATIGVEAAYDGFLLIRARLLYIDETPPVMQNPPCATHIPPPSFAIILTSAFSLLRVFGNSFRSRVIFFLYLTKRAQSGAIPVLVA
jgi:hypothetical protein